MQRRDLNAPDAVQPAAPYSQAVEITGATRTLYLSGQVGADAQGAVPQSVEAQHRLVWRNIEAQLRAAGMGFDNLVKFTTILTDIADLPVSRTVRSEVLQHRRPASTLIVAGLANPAWRVEIEGIACA